MLVFNTDVFNEVITGTATTWYSYAPFDSTIGSSDVAVVFAYATNVTGTGTQLNLFCDTSNDGRLWFPGASQLNSAGTNLLNGLVQQGMLSPVYSFMRLRFTLSGLATAQCQLKLSVTGRSFNGFATF